MTSDFFDDLEARGLIHGASEGAREALAAGSLTVYIGFDPTGPTLHVGHLLPVLVLARLQRAGHRPIALLGGGTGMIGDPSGKTVERQLLTRADVEANVESIRGQCLARASEGAREALAAGSLTVYIGFDPTGPT
ncbi:MAG TPA: hypothetical protein VEQ60_17965, partial [Longimicrobium sp.]|nr:hypothetical protein [Longimicrobium sp.]